MAYPCERCPEWDQYGSCMQKSCPPSERVKGNAMVGTNCGGPLDMGVPDLVNHPPHYQKPWGEVIDITEHMNFNMGNAVKYILRADDKGKPVEDLRKAAWYIARELQRRGEK